MQPFINWGHLTPEQKKERDRREFENWARMRALKAMNEARQTSSTAPVGIGTGRGKAPNWVTVTNTAYLYPIQDIQAALATTAIEIQIIDNRYVFESLQQMDAFYYEVWQRTAQSQPDGNQGYTMGVGTHLTGSFDEIYLDLVNGTRIVVWQKMTMVTPQWQLEVGGNAPDGAVGYAAVYSDIDGDGVPGDIHETTEGSIDPLRFVQE